MQHCNQYDCSLCFSAGTLVLLTSVNRQTVAPQHWHDRERTARKSIRFVRSFHWKFTHCSLHCHAVSWAKERHDRPRISWKHQPMASYSQLSGHALLPFFDWCTRQSWWWDHHALEGQATVEASQQPKQTWFPVILPSLLQFKQSKNGCAKCDPTGLGLHDGHKHLCDCCVTSCCRND